MPASAAALALPGVLPLAPVIAGRPSKYTPELALLICDAIATGSSMRQVCMREGMPNAETVNGWILRNEEFQSLYEIARRRRADAWCEELVDIARNGSDDYIEKESERTGRTFTALNREAIERSRLIINTMQWTMGKMQPKKYGDQVMLSGDPDNPLLFTVDPIDLARRMASALGVMRMLPTAETGATIEHAAGAAIPAETAKGDASA